MSEPKMPNFTGRRAPGAHLMEKATLKDAKGTLKRLLKYFIVYRTQIILAFACAVIATVIIITGTRLNGYTVDNLIAQRNVKMLGIVCLLMISMYIISAASGYAQNLLMVRVAQKLAASIRRDLFNKVLMLPLSFFDAHSSGDLMSRLTNDVENINNSVSQSVVQLFTSIVSVIGMLIAMLILSPMLTLVCLVTMPLTFLITKIVAKYAQRFYVGQQQNLGQMNGYIEEMVSGQKVIRLFSQEEHVISDFENINRKYIKNAIRAQAASGIMGPGNNMINNLSYLLVAVIGGMSVIRGLDGITVGAVFSFLLYMRNFTNPINNILSLANALQLALASAERVFEIMDETPEKQDPDDIRVDSISGDVRFEHVYFSYIPQKPVLKDADIRVKPGQTVALVGPTGAGKTTIISLLTRFYDVDSGLLSIDGNPIETIDRTSLRRSVSLVLQDTFLFSDTIKENIRYGRLDATDEEVIEAAKSSHAHDFITKLPQGYDTILADNGQNLSQGQRQLLNIARSILSKASVLILDEATSSVDTRSEQIIQSALLKLMAGKTCFVIAHRLSTIRNADNIMVIDDGRVIEQGTHGELLAQQGMYARLYDSQFIAL